VSRSWIWLGQCQQYSFTEYGRNGPNKTYLYGYETAEMCRRKYGRIALETMFWRGVELWWGCSRNDVSALFTNCYENALLVTGLRTIDTERNACQVKSFQ